MKRTTDWFVYPLPTDPDYWRQDGGEVPKSFFERLEVELLGFMLAEYPHVALEVEYVANTVGVAGRPVSSLDEV